MWRVVGIALIVCCVICVHFVASLNWRCLIIIRISLMILFWTLVYLLGLAFESFRWLLFFIQVSFIPFMICLLELSYYVLARFYV